MVQLVLDALGGDARDPLAAPPPSPRETGIQCYHVDARFSDSFEDIGRVRSGKLLRLFKYCLDAIGCRCRFGVKTFFYIPAPPIRSAIYRDWLVMLLCRPFFPRRIFYWQAAGLGEWLRTEARGWERGLTRLLVGKPDLSILMGEFCRGDGQAVESAHIELIPNGVPDPCPDFEREVLPRRLERIRTRQKISAAGKSAPLGQFKVLFLSLCTREKGLFDTLEAVAGLNQRLASAQAPIRVQLDVAGKFWREEERVEFEKRIAGSDLNGSVAGSAPPVVTYHGFVAGKEKHQLFLDNDCFCFPSYYQAESFGIVLVEAMAFGLPIIAAKWRTIPELLPKGYEGLVEPKSPAQIAAVLERLLVKDYDPALRARFTENYTVEQFSQKLRAVLANFLERA